MVIIGVVYVYVLDGCGCFLSVNMCDFCIMGIVKY